MYFQKSRRKSGWNFSKTSGNPDLTIIQKISVVMIFYIKKQSTFIQYFICFAHINNKLLNSVVYSLIKTQFYSTIIYLSVLFYLKKIFVIKKVSSIKIV